MVGSMREVEAWLEKAEQTLTAARVLAESGCTMTRSPVLTTPCFTRQRQRL